MSKFEIPESLDGLSIDDLLDLRSQARTAGSDLIKDKDALTDEALAQAEKYAEFIDGVDEKVSAIRSAESERKAAVESIASRLDKDAPEDAVEETPAAETPVEPEAEVEETPAEEIVEEEPAAVAASAKKSTTTAAARAAANAKPLEAPMNQTARSITAAADISGFSAGAPLPDLTAVTAAAQARLRAYPTHRLGGKEGLMMRNGIASFHIPRNDGLSQDNPEFKDNDIALLEYASKESRLAEGGLVAAGGWCAPEDTLMAFCSEVSTDGILDLPSVGASRGSIRFTRGPDFATIFSNANGDWDLTEAQVIADTQKPIIDVECPPFETITLGVTGVSVRAGILTDAAYPELVKDYIEKVLIAHQHKMGLRLYQAIDAAATGLAVAGALNSIDGLASLEFAIAYVRNLKRMSQNTALEVLLPDFYKTVVRADFARRNGVDATNITDQAINAHFALRGARVQWLYNTGQEITAGAPDVDGNLPLTAPTTVDVLMYPAGGFVKLTKDLVTLDGIYDSTNIRTNTFTALFSEEGYAVANMCGDAYKMALPVIATGQTGSAALTANVLPTA